MCEIRGDKKLEYLSEGTQNFSINRYFMQSERQICGAEWPGLGAFSTGFESGRDQKIFDLEIIKNSPSF